MSPFDQEQVQEKLLAKVEDQTDYDGRVALARSSKLDAKVTDSGHRGKANAQEVYEKRQDMKGLQMSDTEDAEDHLRS